MIRYHYITRELIRTLIMKVVPEVDFGNYSKITFIFYYYSEYNNNNNNYELHGPNTNILYNSVVTPVSGHTLFQVTAKRLNLFQPPSVPVLFYHVDVSRSFYR